MHSFLRWTSINKNSLLNNSACKKNSEVYCKKSKDGSPKCDKIHSLMDDASLMVSNIRLFFKFCTIFICLLVNVQ